MYRLMLLATIILTTYSAEQVHTTAQVKSQIINFINSNSDNVFATSCDITQTICSQAQDTVHFKTLTQEVKNFYVDSDSIVFELQPHTENISDTSIIKEYGPYILKYNLKDELITTYSSSDYKDGKLTLVGTKYVCKNTNTIFPTHIDRNFTLDNLINKQLNDINFRTGNITASKPLAHTEILDQTLSPINLSYDIKHPVNFNIDPSIRQQYTTKALIPNRQRTAAAVIIEYQEQPRGCPWHFVAWYDLTTNTFIGELIPFFNVEIDYYESLDHTVQWSNDGTKLYVIGRTQISGERKGKRSIECVEYKNNTLHVYPAHTYSSADYFKISPNFDRCIIATEAPNGYYIKIFHNNKKVKKIITYQDKDNFVLLPTWLSNSHIVYAYYEKEEFVIENIKLTTAGNILDREIRKISPPFSLPYQGFKGMCYDSFKNLRHVQLYMCLDGLYVVIHKKDKNNNYYIYRWNGSEYNLLGNIADQINSCHIICDHDGKSLHYVGVDKNNPSEFTYNLINLEKFEKLFSRLDIKSVKKLFNKRLYTFNPPLAHMCAAQLGISNNKTTIISKEIYNFAISIAPENNSKYPYSLLFNNEQIKLLYQYSQLIKEIIQGHITMPISNSTIYFDLPCITATAIENFFQILSSIEKVDTLYLLAQKLHKKYQDLAFNEYLHFMDNTLHQVLTLKNYFIVTSPNYNYYYLCLLKLVLVDIVKRLEVYFLSDKQVSILKDITLLQAELEKLEPSSLDKFLSTFTIHQYFDDLYKLNDFCDI